ncbi:LacI family DNA-binding transcriptional regulator [Thalassotalea agariperforans]
MTTIKDVAFAAGVSTALVSRVINNKPGVSIKKREIIQKIMQEMGYFPNTNARSIKFVAKSAIGVILPDLITPYFACMVQGIEKIALAANVQLVLNSSSFNRDKELAAIETLVEHRYQSIVLFSPSISDEKLIYFASKVPGLTLIDRYIPAIADRCVFLDDFLAGTMMATYLLNNHHNHIAIIDLPHSLLNSCKRLDGIKTRLAEANIILPPSLIELSNGSVEGGRAAAYNLLASGQKFTAIACLNDATAYGVITFLQEQGIKVPEDVSVIGFNGSLYSKICRPTFATIYTPVADIAARATKLSLQLVKSAHLYIDESENKFQPTLIKNQSVSTVKTR